MTHSRAKRAGQLPHNKKDVDFFASGLAFI